MTAQTYIRRGKQRLFLYAAQLGKNRLFHSFLWGGGGFLSAAASIGNLPQPLNMGLICAARGWDALAAAVGSAVGFRVFWGSGGLCGLVWSLAALAVSLFLSPGEETKKRPLLPPAMGALAVAAGGLVFLFLESERLSFPMFLLRCAGAAGSVWLLPRALWGKDPLLRWLAEGAAMLALVQVAPLPWLSVGFLCAGFLAAREALPGLALAGLAMDIAGVTPVPMTGALCLAFLGRLLPASGRWIRGLLPGVGFALIMGLSGVWDIAPLPGLLAGGLLGTALPGEVPGVPRRGPTGLAQVRLEMMAGVLTQTRQLLTEGPQPAIDTAALLHRTRERACGGCPNRKQCRDIDLPPDSLRRHYTDSSSLEIPCKKPGRMLLELRRSQEQLRSLEGDRRWRETYREAAAQQYQFMAEYLRQQSDQLTRRAEGQRICYQADVGVCTAGKEAANGDRCLWFSGPHCRYYILLCDGMGTGIGAREEVKEASDMLKQMLSAGFPAEYALRSLNSLCVLRQMAGAVTVDLAEICLDSGRLSLYKWGAAPSFLLRRSGAEKIGTAGPPPGLSVSEARETVDRLSLRRGEALILTSDGVDGEDVLRRLRIDPAEPPGEVAALLVEHGTAQEGDDATAAVIRLRGVTLGAS